MIKGCIESNSNQKDCKDNFRHVFTSRGICSSLNAPSFLELFKSHPRIQTFSSVFPTSSSSQLRIIRMAEFDLMLDLHGMNIAKISEKSGKS